MDVKLSPIFRLPPELLLLVLEILDIPDILHVRQTCRTLSKATYERSIWMKKLEEQETYLPLPTELLDAYRNEDRHLHTYPDSAIESIAMNAAHVSNMWRRPRLALSYKLEREQVGKTLMGMKLFLDRWLMVVYYEGAAYLYDTQPVHHPVQSSVPGSQFEPTGKTNTNSRPILRAKLFLESGLWITHVAAVDSAEQKLFLSLSRSVQPHMVQIYKVNLKFLASNSLFIPNAFQLAKSILLPSYKVIRAIEPAQRLVALSTSGVVELVKWDEWNSNLDDTMNRKIIRVNPDDLEGLWNGIIAVHFLGSYVLIFRTRSLEIHEHPSALHIISESESQPIFKHMFSMTYREVSFSQTIISQHPISETETYETTLFAYDVIQGLFHYVVRVQASISRANDLPSSCEVILTGAYPLAPDLHNPGLYIPLASEDALIETLPKSVTYSANFTPSPSPTPTFSHAHTHVPGSSSTIRLTQGGQFDDGSRGFLSTHAMGPQGKRAIWIERKRSSTLREIQVWSHNSPSFISSYKDQLSTNKTSAIEIPRRVVYSLYSYDLRDDITCCTFGELNGNIILGHRSGDVSILELQA